MRYLVINTKNYLAASGKRIDRLASYLKSNNGRGRETRVFFAVPAFDLRYLHYQYPAIRLLAQHLDDSKAGASTGALVPEIAKAAGATGSIINHSEHRVDERTISSLVRRLRDLNMVSIVCARDENEVSRFSRYNPSFIAIEPPELIGSGNAVSKVSPQIVSRSKKALRSKSRDFRTKLLCGAGIVDGIDARRAIELGSDGILVASGVVLSRNWKGKIAELLQGLNDARKR